MAVGIGQNLPKDHARGKKTDGVNGKIDSRR
jgi:hypothetical protein